jgi:hypothetical protein
LRIELLEDRTVPDANFGPWSAPVNLGPAVNTAFGDQHPAISPDGLSLYITSNRLGSYGSFDLWVSHRATRDGVWGTPVNLGKVINGAGRDFSPVFSPDGHWMIYARSLDGNENGDDLYITHRDDKDNDLGWAAPVSLGPNINVPGYGDSGPALFEDPVTGLLNLYFTSNRPGGVGDWDIYRSVRQEDGTWTPAELVPEVSSPYRDVRTTIRSDGLEMILTATNPAYLPGPNPQAALDLYVSTRASTQDTWSTPVNLGLTVNSPSPTVADSAPYLSRDGKTLYFYSNRSGSTLDMNGKPSNDLYVCTREELEGAPLEASSVRNNSAAATLNSRQVAALLPEAIQRWQAVGVDAFALGNIQIQITNLSGRTLGLADEFHRTIYLDANAAGWGWFVDQTPWDDSEFATPGNQGEQNRMDLLTVLEHEVGHLLGKEHEATGVMQETLAPGIRLVPGSGHDWLAVVDHLRADALFAGANHHRQQR